MAELREKYDRAAAGFTRRTYAAPDVYFGRRIDVLKAWGPPLLPGQSVLDLGCGDGTMSARLLALGLSVTACDFSEQMLVETARQCRAAARPGALALRRADINDVRTLPDERFDHCVAIMGSFFTYAADPLRPLRHLAERTRSKVVVDVDPRAIRPAEAVRLMRDAGLRGVRLRAFLVPQRQRLPRAVQRSLYAIEEVAPLYRLLTWRKFHLWILGVR